MKNVLFFLLAVSLGVAGCRSENAEDLQKIDQVVHMYVDSLGQDMLNPKIPGSYVSVNMNDVDGLTDNAPVSVNLRKDADTLSYIYYIAGARRVLIGSSQDDTDHYRSRIALSLRRQVNDSTQTITNDTLVLNYTHTPKVFELAAALYNGIPVFTKVEGEPNIIKIYK